MVIMFPNKRRNGNYALHSLVVFVGRFFVAQLATDIFTLLRT